jgi:hypothetical protein
LGHSKETLQNKMYLEITEVVCQRIWVVFSYLVIFFSTSYLLMFYMFPEHMPLCTLCGLMHSWRRMSKEVPNFAKSLVIKLIFWQHGSKHHWKTYLAKIFAFRR